MKKYFIFILAFTFQIVIAQISNTKFQISSESKINYVELNSNNIKLYLQNIGNTKNYTGAGGGYWNILNDQVIVYDHGPWIIGKIDNKVHLALVQWYRNYESSVYSPGPIINNKPVMIEKPADSLKYRIYKISKNDFTSKDYLEWPKEFGAPIKNDGKPKLYGDQTTWCVYNSLDPSTSYRNEWNIKKDSLPIMPIEIQQLVYSRKGSNITDDDLYANVVFYEYTIINKGSKPIDSTYFSFWADIDFSSGINNFPACDSTLDLAYLWSNKTLEQPAVGVTLLYGPTISKIGSKAFFKGKEITNKSNLKLSSVHGIIENSSSIQEPGKPASSRNEAWNIAKGLFVDGNKMIDPTNNKSTKFMFNGDPISNKGWLFNSNSGGEAGFNLFTGPFNLAPNDTQWIMLALVPANGKDYKESISKLRNKVKLLKSIQYDSLAFGNKSVVVNVESENIIPDEFDLKQNYPNPFNPSTTIEFAVKESGNYSLKVYDMLGQEVATLINNNINAGAYKVKFDASKLSSGIYIYRLVGNNVNLTKKMILTK